MIALRYLVHGLTLLVAFVGARANPGLVPTPGYSLQYDRPAEAWTEALPLGNGRMGAMVFGGIERERFQLNEDTLTSGEPPSAMARARTRSTMAWMRPSSRTWEGFCLMRAACVM